MLQYVVPRFPIVRVVYLLGCGKFGEATLDLISAVMLIVSRGSARQGGRSVDDVHMGYWSLAAPIETLTYNRYSSQKHL